MNHNKLLHNNANIINMNDPWNLGFKVTGVAKVNINQQLSAFAEDLVYEYGTYEDYSFSVHLLDLSESYTSELLRLFIESIDREIDPEAIYGEDTSVNSDYNCALMFMLLNNTSDNQKNLSQVIRKNLIIYYHESLQKILDDAAEAYTSNMHEQNNISFSYDREHGDLVREGA